MNFCVSRSGWVNACPSCSLPSRTTSLAALMNFPDTKERPHARAMRTARGSESNPTASCLLIAASTGIVPEPIIGSRILKDRACWRGRRSRASCGAIRAGNGWTIGEEAFTTQVSALEIVTAEGHEVNGCACRPFRHPAYEIGSVRTLAPPWRLSTIHGHQFGASYLLRVFAATLIVVDLGSCLVVCRAR